MPAKSKLKNALAALDHAKKSLNRAKDDIDDDYDIPLCGPKEAR